MKKAVLVTLLASTLGLGAATVMANDTTTTKETESSCSKHKDGKQSGKRDGKHHGKRGGQHGGQHMMKRMAKKLDLTDAQQTQMKASREAQKAEKETLRESMKSLRTEMRALDTKSADYQTQVSKLADKKAALDRQQFILRAAARQKFEAILTAEQLTKLKAMKEKRQSRHGKHEDK